MGFGNFELKTSNLEVLQVFLQSFILISAWVPNLYTVKWKNQNWNWCHIRCVFVDWYNLFYVLSGEIFTMEKEFRNEFVWNFVLPMESRRSWGCYIHQISIITGDETWVYEYDETVQSQSIISNIFGIKPFCGLSFWPFCYFMRTELFIFFLNLSIVLSSWSF